MPTEVNRKITVFYCYARKDRDLRNELQQHLITLTRHYHLVHWYDGEINPGTTWEPAINTHLNRADLVFLLISSYFLASDYCYGKEMTQALARHEAGTCCVIPILLRPVYWKDTPFSKLQMLPTDARPVTNWPDPHDAFYDIAREVSKTIKVLIGAFEAAAEWLNKGKTQFELEKYTEALAACEQAILLDPNNTFAYSSKGAALNELKRYEEALEACEQATLLDPGNTLAYNNLGNALNELKRYEEALHAYEQAILLDPGFTVASQNKENVRLILEEYKNPG